MPLLVGLGNPGPKYDATRHNIGFALADSVAVSAGADGWKTWGKALVCKVPQGSAPLSSLLLAKPQTFMNLSGEAVQALMAFYKIPPSEVLIVTDDVTLPIGSLRIRSSGGHGGHNGLRDIIEKIGEGFPRIRVGLGMCPPGRDMSAFVLARMTADEQGVLKPLFGDFQEILATGFTKGWEAAASKFNKRAQ